MFSDNDKHELLDLTTFILLYDTIAYYQKSTLPRVKSYGPLANTVTFSVSYCHLSCPPFMLSSLAPLKHNSLPPRYVHNQQWPSAQRVAENYDPDSVPDILVGQARQAFQEQNYSKFESLLLRAGRSEMAIGLYKVWSREDMASGGSRVSVGGCLCV